MSKIIDVKTIEKVVVISTEGYFNKDLGEAVQEVVNEHIDKGNVHYLLNLKNSNIVNSIGASIVIEIIETLQTKNGSLNFCNLAPIIEKTFKIMGLTKYCKSFSEENEALAEIEA